ncbi:transcriptional regulator [Streptomyces nojiriensis]|uniref:Transcriptional regulator n=1 Tax=Streptomyces nojiriensis TaxID=66374 RepID=A0ABQ3SYK7_9ACTN|nr:AraC family transcriptional regulator [Streptomyces nojiriensis]QTI46735.1 HTH-type transcriptional activator RhaR [Streptomyces nojiriensis]GGS00972.1 transcriptional regulator [Streptomyces nojiriensis]GHI73218.1 transcriptional regulator [Streptomyces nojiriensis]
MCRPAWRQALIEAAHLKDLARLRRVRDRIDREYARPLDVEELARAADMAAGHLGRRFRLAYGASPYAYLTARRIERATALLRGGGLGVDEVRRAVGCPTPGIFSTRFTELVGMAPGAYPRAVRSPAAPAEPVRIREASAPAPELA